LAAQKNRNTPPLDSQPDMRARFMLFQSSRKMMHVTGSATKSNCCAKCVW